MEQNEWIYTVNKYVVLSFSSRPWSRCTILIILVLSSWNLRSHHRHLVVDVNVSWHAIDASGSRLHRCFWILVTWSWIGLSSVAQRLGVDGLEWWGAFIWEPIAFTSCWLYSASPINPLCMLIEDASSTVQRLGNCYPLRPWHSSRINVNAGQEETSHLLHCAPRPCGGATWTTHAWCTCSIFSFWTRDL